MALKEFLMIGTVAAVLVACGDDGSGNSVTNPDEEFSSSACEDCDGSSSSKAKASSSSSVTPQSSERETSVSSSSKKGDAGKSSSSVKSSSSAKSSSSKEIATNSSSSRNDEGGKSSSSVASNSSVPEGYVDSTTVVKGTMTDERDGQTYKTVKIGTQTWMAENLNYAYTGVPYNYSWYTSDSTSWCYDNNASNCAKYGRLYTWAAAMDSVGTWSANGKGCGYEKICSPTYPVRGVCPEGWHLPTKAEFETLFTAVGGSSTAGRMLKSTSGWNDSKGRDGNGTDAYSFSALPAGYRYGSGGYDLEGVYANFWSSTEYYGIHAYDMDLDYVNDTAYLNYHSEYDGCSVRCLMD